MEREKVIAETAAWVDSLAQWSTFFTGTTYYPASQRSMGRSFKAFMRKNYPSISYVYALEPHADIESGFHVHAMFANSFHVQWKTFWKRWFDKFGFNQTTPIQSKPNVVSYITKYVIKQWNREYNPRVCKMTVSREVWWDVHLPRHQSKLKLKAA
jgi:hypothetical protein